MPPQRRRHDTGTATRILLVRHAHTDAVGRCLAGRTPGVALSEAGRAQLPRLADGVTRLRPVAVYASPLDRAMETARAIADAAGLKVAPCEPLMEVDFGEWTGRTFDDLETLPEWQRFNSHRSTAPVPGGEPAAAVQVRILGALEELRAAHPGETIAAVTHADVIRAAILSHAGSSLDMVHRIEIRPASMSALLIGDGWSRIQSLNVTFGPE
jgi:probable phosphoglycerate mutase